MKLPWPFKIASTVRRGNRVEVTVTVYDPGTTASAAIARAVADELRIRERRRRC